MGVTIHYEGSLRDDAAVDSLIEIASDYAQRLGWPIDSIDDSKNTIHQVGNVSDGDELEPVRGFIIRPHENSEPLRFEFDEKRFLQGFVKTQFAPIQVHIQIIDLLRQLSFCFVDLSVSDEGEYWDTSDQDTLESHFKRCFMALDAALAEDPRRQGPVRLKSGRIVDFVDGE